MGTAVFFQFELHFCSFEQHSCSSMELQVAILTGWVQELSCALGFVRIASW